jgi:hypothetical protein
MQATANIQLLGSSTSLLNTRTELWTQLHDGPIDVAAKTLVESLTCAN